MSQFDWMDDDDGSGV